MSAFTHHGGRLDAAVRRFPDAPRPWLDLSTGINPRAYPADAIGRADHAALPSPAALAALETAAAAAFGAGAVAAVPGTEVALRLLATLGLPAPAIVARDTYRTHAAALPGARAAGRDDLVAAEAGTVLLANPNNPDGRLEAPDRLLALARALGRRGGWLIVDEAFADAQGDEQEDASVLPLLAPGDPVLVLRSFGKFYGLAGVRLGFACGHPALVGGMRARLGDWPVSAGAIAVGTAAYRDAAWQRATRARLAGDAAALDAVLRRHGLEPRGECPLFRLVETAHADALFARLAAAGILARPFAGGGRLRFGLPADAAALARLDRALDGWARHR